MYPPETHLSKKLFGITIKSDLRNAKNNSFFLIPENHTNFPVTITAMQGGYAVNGIAGHLIRFYVYGFLRTKNKTHNENCKGPFISNILVYLLKFIHVVLSYTIIKVSHNNAGDVHFFKKIIPGI